MGVPVCPERYYIPVKLRVPVPEEGYPGKLLTVLHLSISLTPLVFHVSIITMNLMRVVEKDDEVEVPLPFEFL